MPSLPGNIILHKCPSLQSQVLKLHMMIMTCLTKYNIAGQLQTEKTQTLKNWTCTQSCTSYILQPLNEQNSFELCLHDDSAVVGVVAAPALHVQHSGREMLHDRPSCECRCLLEFTNQI